MSIAGELIIEQRAAFDRQLGRLTGRERGLVDKALAEIERDLKRAKPGTWTEAKAKATMAMLRDAVRQLAGGQYTMLRNRLGGFARLGQMQVADFLQSLDEEFLGAAQPLRWDSIQWLRGYARPAMRSRLKIYRRSFARYGAEAVDEIEGAVARKMLLGKPWTEAREEVMAAVKDVVEGKQWMVDRILRTEVSTIHSATTMAALFEEDEPDDPMLKKLVATFDPITAADSKALHGQAVPVRELFTDAVNGRTFDHPPNRPNDRELLVGWRESWGDETGFDEDTSEFQDDDVEAVDYDEPEDVDIGAAMTEAAASVVEESIALDVEGVDEEWPVFTPPPPPRSQKAAAASLRSLSPSGVRLRDMQGQVIPPSGKLPPGKMPGWDKIASAELNGLNKLKWRPELVEIRTEIRGDDFAAGMMKAWSSREDELQRCGLSLNLHNIGVFQKADRNIDRIAVADGEIPWSAAARIPESELTRLKKAYGHIGLDDDTMLSLVKIIRHEYGHGVEFNLIHRAKHGDLGAAKLLNAWEAARDSVSDATWGKGHRRKHSGGEMPELPAGFSIPAPEDAGETWYQISEYATTDEFEMFAETFELAMSDAWDSIPVALRGPMRDIITAT